MSHDASARLGPAPAVLAPADVEAIAQRVVALLCPPAHKLLKASEVAHLLAVDVAFVYAHQHELGVLRLPTTGRRAALRFDRDTVLELLRRRAGEPAPRPPRRPGVAGRYARRAVIDLLPYEPRSAA